MTLKKLPCFYSLLTSIVLVMLVSGCSHYKKPQLITEFATEAGTVKAGTKNDVPTSTQQVGNDEPKRVEGGNSWGAIASIPPTNLKAYQSILLGFAIVNNRSSQQEAEKAALQMCNNDRQKGCLVRYIFNKQCVAFSYDSKLATYGWSVATTGKEATQRAQTACNNKNKEANCELYYVTCPE